MERYLRETLAACERELAKMREVGEERQALIVVGQVHALRFALAELLQCNVRHINQVAAAA